MSLVTASNLSKGFGAQSVLEDISVRVGRGEKVGIVGKNGGGKSTLLKILIGRETADSGNVHVAKGIRIGYLSQISTLEETRTVREEARTALDALFDAEQELREAEEYLARNPEDEEALEAYGAAQDRYEFAGGPEAETNLFGALTAMGFADSDLDKPVSVLSGGEKTRLSMAKLLASAPDVLALDEPTNHLDIRAVEWLEGFLQRFPRRGPRRVARPPPAGISGTNGLGSGGTASQSVYGRLCFLPQPACCRARAAIRRVRAATRRDFPDRGVYPAQQSRAKRPQCRRTGQAVSPIGTDRKAS